jgi:AraC-like DNA-binding protein
MQNHIVDSHNKMTQVALNIIKSNVFIVPSAIITALVVALVIYFSSINDMIIFPDLDNHNFDFYTDAALGGNSTIANNTVSDSVISFEYRLNDAFHSPYAGISISPKNAGYINAKRYNNIKLTIKGENTERIGFALFTPSQFSHHHSLDNNALYHSYLNISNIKSSYNIAIKQLKHPEWWEDLHLISKSTKPKIPLDSIINITIGTAFSPDINNYKTLEIYSLSFTKNNTKLFTGLAIAYFAFVAMLYFTLFISSTRKNKTKSITVFYKPLDVSTNNEQINNCVIYINNNFSNCDLSLDLVSKETSITSRQITATIHAEFNCNFKTYLNRLRINESKRLLQFSNLNIGEIAYKVGFNNQSHFNRVFKNELNISPTEFRELNKS